MTHEYNNQVARHYAAFRPDLHAVILSRLILPGERFKIGLDVGCGTGCSSIALADYRFCIMNSDLPCNLCVTFSADSMLK